MSNKHLVLYGFVLYILTELSIKIVSNILLFIKSMLNISDIIYLFCLILYCLACLYLILFREKFFLHIKTATVIFVVLLYFILNSLFSFFRIDNTIIVYSITKSIDGLFPIIFLAISYIKYWRRRCRTRCSSNQQLF
jgi:hypothetical protein